MSGASWGSVAPPAAVVGILALAVWIALAPPPRSARGLLRLGAALLLALALLDVGCRRAAEAARPRAVVLVDRSLSMRVAGRDAAAREWLDRLDVALEGWRVERDSFGGATTDLVEPIARAEARLPDAIVVVSDGRAAGGRAAETPGVPLFVHTPGPPAIEDLAVLDLAVEMAENGGGIVEVETSTVGGLPALARPIVVLVDGRPAGGAAAGAPYAAAERRVERIAVARLPSRAVVEARLVGMDAVIGNDRRARVVGDGAGPATALLVALRPGWEFGSVRRALETAPAAPVEAVWAPSPGRLAPLDRPGSASWTSLSPDRYRTAWLFGDPALLGDGGAEWLRRFAASGGRGILWATGGQAGALPGADAVVPGGARASAVPALTAAGARWLIAHGGSLDPAPDGTSAWPPLELLPAASEVPRGATPLLEAGGRPAAWVAERGASRVAVLLGTGYYRWPLSAGEEPRAFWNGWIATLARWLSGASTADRPLVRMPLAGRVTAGAPLEAAVTARGDVAWRVERADGEVVAEGSVAAGVAERVVRAGPFTPGVYRLAAEAGRGTAAPRLGAVEPFVVETWAPDLAWTAADTASLAQAARASGGGLLGASPRLPALPRRAEAIAAGRVFGLGTTPWVYLLVAVLLLVDWGLGPRARR